MPRGRRASPEPRFPHYRTLYVRNPADHALLAQRAKEANLSFSEYVLAAAKGDLLPPGGREAERLRALEEDAKYWRERFERMAALAQDMQAEILQLRQELRLKEVGSREGGATPDALATALAPKVLKVLATLRGADGKWRVWTETEMREELDIDPARDVVQSEGLRGALAQLFRMNLIEPVRNGWRYRE